MQKLFFFILFFIVIIQTGGQSQKKDIGKLEAAHKLNETARFISGLGVDKNSSLYLYSNSSQYLSYKKSIDSLWNLFEKQKLQKISNWQTTQLPANHTPVVFYPFSGPDIANALAFFPKAEKYIMVGLESPGEVPNPYVLKNQSITYRLWHIRKALRTLLRINFFRTQEMWQDIKVNSFSSLTGIFMFFLCKYDYEIIAINKISLNKNGDIIKRSSGSTSIIRGVEIVFKKNNSSLEQKLVYFKVDISDKPLKTKIEFVRFLGKHNNFTSFTKAASYLLSYSNFKTIRTYMLTRSKYIVQSDCGIPYRFYDKNKWNISLYGRYVVLKMFIKLGRYQHDYALAMKGLSKSLLPFSFGYGYSPGRSNLLFAEKKNSD